VGRKVKNHCCILCLQNEMTTSTNHVQQKAKMSQQIFCLKWQNSPGKYIENFANYKAGHGRVDLKKINVLGPRAVNGLDVAGYWRSGPEKSWTVPSLTYIPNNIIKSKSG